jgi:glycosyltransferase involved in cell wall biosynthesis
MARYQYRCISSKWKDFTMKTTCIINNYNYAQYVEAAIQSVLDQTVAFDEIIVVDDGSTDNSLELISASIKNCQNAKLIAKKNQGQLSCFNEGFKASSGDLIFFLDSDDLYMPNYLEMAENFYYNDKECDFLFCPIQEFGKSNSLKKHYPNYCEKTGTIGHSLLSTLYGKSWIGGGTSTLSMKRTVLNKILPLPFLEEWRISADVCLVYGSSLVGAKKYFMPKPLIKYRVHEHNYYYGRFFSTSNKFKKKLAAEQLIQYILKKNYYYSNFYHLIYKEYKTLPSPDFKTTKFYLNLLNRSNLSKNQKKVIKRQILKKYVKTRIGKTTNFLPAPSKRE